MLSRPNLITITGQPGAGKSTACRRLSEELGWEYFYTGMVMRKLGEEMGLSIAEINKRAETDRSIDRKVDEVYISLRNSEKPLVIDARLAFHFLPESFKVRFEVSNAVGAQRVLAADKRTGEQYRDLATAMQTMEARRQSEIVHYHNSYGIANVEDYAHFDLVLDTSHSSPDRNVSFVRAAFSLWQKGIHLPKVWLSPKSLYPTAALKNMSEESAQNLVKQYQNVGYDILSPILAVQVNDQVHIVDGHHRISAAIRAQCDFIPVIMLGEGHDGLRGKSPASYVKSKAKADDIYAWERAHGFLFTAPSNVK